MVTSNFCKDHKTKIEHVDRPVLLIFFASFSLGNRVTIQKLRQNNGILPL
jgi:hypothetical protein